MKISLSVAVLAFSLLGTQPLCAQFSAFGEDFGVPGASVRTTVDPLHPIGFQSPYQYFGTVNQNLPDQRVGIANSPSAYNTLATPTTPWGTFGDHTNGTGYMLVVNGSTPQTGNGPYFYSHTENSISAGTSFQFSFWARNALPAASNFATLVVGYSVNGGASFSFVTPSTNNSLVNYNTWNQVVATIPASSLGTASSVMFALFDSSGVQTGNAFAVDDISITGVPESSTVFAGVAALGLVGLALRQRQANRAVRPDAFACA